MVENRKNEVNVRMLIDQNRKSLNFPKYADLIIEHPESVKELVDLAVSGKAFHYPQYASWLLLHIARKRIDLVHPFYQSIIEGILTTRNRSALRSLLGVSLCLPLESYRQVDFLDRLIQIASDPESKPGHLLYANRKLEEFKKLYPDLQEELNLIRELRNEIIASRGNTRFIKKTCRDLEIE